MSAEYSVEEVREAAETNEHPIPLRVRSMLTAYAERIKADARPVAQGEVSVYGTREKEAVELASILDGLHEGGYDLENLYVTDPADGDCFVARAADLLREFVAQPRAVPADFAEYLKDPANVHVMMLRGVIAIPSIRSIVHLRGEVPNGEDAQLARIAELQEQVATLKDKPAERVPDAKAMAYRFMGWRLPDDFRPDAGISFTPPTNPAWWPIGTNLLHVGQAEQMFRYVLAAAPSPGESE